jgi:hypothetical protein
VPALGGEDVHREHREREREDHAGQHGGEHELDREEHEHDRGVAATEPQGDQRGDGVERDGDGEEQLDPLASGERQRP